MKHGEMKRNFSPADFTTRFLASRRKSCGSSLVMVPRGAQDLNADAGLLKDQDNPGSEARAE